MIRAAAVFALGVLLSSCATEPAVANAGQTFALRMMMDARNSRAASVREVPAAREVAFVVTGPRYAGKHAGVEITEPRGNITKLRGRVVSPPPQLLILGAVFQNPGEYRAVLMIDGAPAETLTFRVAR